MDAFDALFENEADGNEVGVNEPEDMNEVAHGGGDDIDDNDECDSDDAVDNEGNDGDANDVPYEDTRKWAAPLVEPAEHPICMFRLCPTPFK